MNRFTFCSLLVLPACGLFSGPDRDDDDDDDGGSSKEDPLPVSPSVAPQTAAR